MNEQWLNDEIDRQSNVIQILMSMLKATGVASTMLDDIVKEAYEKPIH